MNSIVQKMMKLGLFLLLIGTASVSAQEVNYTVVENKPYTNVLNIGIQALDFKLVGGTPMAGPTVNVQFRPLDRILVEGDLGSAIYAKSIDESTSVSGLKKAGGLFVRAGGAFVWYQKGKNLTKEKGDTQSMGYRFNLKTTSMYQKSVTSYIMFPYNRMVERTIRAGGFYHNFPTVEGISSSQGFYVGLGKMTYKAATLDIEGYGELARSVSVGYHLDLLMGTSNFNEMVDGSLSHGGMSMVFGFDMLYTGGLFPISASLEFGGYPGGSGFLGVKFAGNILSGKRKYDGDYKYSKKRKGKLAAILQQL